MQRKFFIIIFITHLLLPTHTSGQKYNLLFKHITANDGLSSNNILAITQDGDGFMWFGTDAGLNKFDGYNFTVYSASGTSGSLRSDNIVALMEDSYGILWVGTDSKGLSLFDKEKGTFHNIYHQKDNPKSLSGDLIRSIFEDSEKNIWIGTAGGGLCLFNRRDSTFSAIKSNPGSSNTIGSNYIGSITEDSLGNLWLGSTTGYLIKFNKADSTFTNYKVFHDITGDILSPITGRTYIDSDGDIWYLTTEGVAIFNNKHGSFSYLQQGSSEHNLNLNDATEVLEYKKGVFFILVDHGGINIYNKKTGKISYHKNIKYDDTSINSNQVQSICRSKGGIVWIGTYNKGVNILRDKDKFHNYQELLTPEDKLKCCNPTLSMVKAPDGNIWLGSDGEGINVWNPATGRIQQHLSSKIPNTIKSNIISSLYCDKQGNILVGYFLEGMSFFDWNKKCFKYYKHDYKGKDYQYLNSIWCFLQENENKYWIGTHYGGLKLFDIKNNTYQIYKTNTDTSTVNGSIRNDFITKLFRDSRGELWVGTIDGLNRFDKKRNKFISYTTRDNVVNKIKGEWVHDILESRNGKLWISTEKALNLYSPETDDFIHFDENNGIGGRDIKCILEDKQNNLWLSTDKGITRFNYTKKTFKNFDVSEYLKGMEFDENAGLVMPDGKMYFGSQNGFVTFSPDNMEPDTSKSRLFITGINVTNRKGEQVDNNTILKKDMIFTDTVTLTWQQNDISFKFAYLSYYNSKDNTYKYMLDGYDPEWINNGINKVAKYTNLDPGTYIFKVKGANCDGIWCNKPAEIVVNIIPPFWKTWWFITLEGLLAIFATIAIIYLRSRSLHKDKLKLKAKVEERTKELKEQSEELKELNVLLEESKEEVVQQNELLIQHRANLENTVNQRTKELVTAKEKAEESDRLKSAFLANMSHEIRTPLNAIVGFSKIISETDTNEEERKLYSGIINENSDSLLMLINDILDFSTIEANQLEIKKSAFDLKEFFEALYSSFSTEKNSSEVELKLNIAADIRPQHIYSDKLRLKQILVNLMQNALKFTTKGYVEFGYYIDSGNLIMYVKDTGPGISEEGQKYIFERFRKFAPLTDQKIKGIGLGLSISKRLTELLGGILTVESEIGKGAVFYFSVPVEKIFVNNVKEDNN